MESIENGIWLCERHGSLIDKNDGVDFAPALLRKWRIEAELRAELAQSGSTRLHPRIGRLVFQDQSFGGAREINAAIELDRLTYVAARDSAAYSFLCELLERIESAPSRFAALLRPKQSIEFGLEFTPGGDHLRVFLSDDEVKYWRNGQAAQSMVGAYVTYRIGQDGVVESGAWLPGSLGESEDHAGLLRDPEIDPLVARRIARSISDHATVMLDQLHYEKGEWLATCRTHRRDRRFELAALSGSEALGAKIDVVLAVARTRSEPLVLVLLDEVVWKFDADNRTRLARACAALPPNVQVIATGATQFATEFEAEGWLVETLSCEPHVERGVRVWTGHHLGPGGRLRRAEG